MIAKTLSTLKPVKGLIILAISLLIILPSYIFIINKSNNSILDCAGNVHIDISDTPSHPAVQGNIHLIFHIVPGELSYVYERGLVKHMGKEYNINRNMRSFFHKETQNGFYRVSREGIDKNPSDNIPDSLAEELASSQKVLFLKVENLDKELWRISDLRRTLFVCKKIHNSL